MSPDAADSRARLEVDWLRATAGALAAVVSAVLLSQLGAAGTILGAALGSLVVTISSALFAQGLTSSRRSLAKAQANARQKVGIAEAELSRAERAEGTAARESHLAHAGERVSEANRELDAALTDTESGAAGDTAPAGWRDRVAELPWKRIWLMSLAFFVAAIAVITVFELVAGRSVASFTGGTNDNQGTTIGNVVHEPATGSQDQPGQGTTESPTPTGSTTPTGEPASEAPTTTGPPTETPTPSPSEAPTESPSGLQDTGQPSASPTP